MNLSCVQCGRWARFVWVVLCGSLLGGCSVPGEVGRADTFGLDFTMPPGTRFPGAVVFVVDGLNGDTFDEMLQAGELPAIKKYFADRGLFTPRAVASTPSVTLPNLTSLVTGLFPGHHGVTGNNWFDRNRLVWRDYGTIAQKDTLDGDFTAATVYELLHERMTASVFLQPHRGATRWVENWTSAGPPFFFGWYEFVDRLTLFRLNLITGIARRRGEFPAVVFCYLLAPDFRAYGFGVNSREYRDAIRHCDFQIGRVLGDVERAGLLDKVYVALVSDHSLGTVTRHRSMSGLLGDKMGLNLASERLWENTSFEERARYYERYSAVIYGGGDRYISICLRRPIRRDGKAAGFEPWTVRPAAGDLAAYPASRRPKPQGLGGLFAPPPGQTCVDLPAGLVREESVDAVAYAAGPDRVRVRRRGGEVEFAGTPGKRGHSTFLVPSLFRPFPPEPILPPRPPNATKKVECLLFPQPAPSGGDGETITYRLLSGSDPFGWKGRVTAEALNGRGASARQWLEWTAGTDFPDLPAQILACFRARRCGDIVVFAAEGWDFDHGNRAGHGGLRPSDIRVPLLLAGPGVPHARLGAVRTIDLMPTLLALLGRPVPSGLDGKTLLPAPP